MSIKTKLTTSIDIALAIKRERSLPFTVSTGVTAKVDDQDIKLLSIIFIIKFFFIDGEIFCRKKAQERSYISPPYIYIPLYIP